MRPRSIRLGWPSGNTWQPSTTTVQSCPSAGRSAAAMAILPSVTRMAVIHTAITQPTKKETGETLSSYLNDKIFAGQTGTTLQPEPEDVKGFEAFLEEYKRLLPAEKAAVAAK